MIGKERGKIICRGPPGGTIMTVAWRHWGNYAKPKFSLISDRYSNRPSPKGKSQARPLEPVSSSPFCWHMYERCFHKLRCVGKACQMYHKQEHSLICHLTSTLESKVTGHGGPQGCETSRLPHFLHNRLTDGVEVVSLTRRPPFTPQEDSWYSFLLLESTAWP
jgi:hypothetical protein